MFLGIDIGTSGVKTVLLSESGALVEQSSVALTVRRPHPLWSEQKPEDWWDAADRAQERSGNRPGRSDAWGDLAGQRSEAAEGRDIVE